MKFPVKKVVNENAIKNGRVDLNFIPLSIQKNDSTGCTISIEVANTNSGAILHFTTGDSEGEIINSSFQYIPGMVPLITEKKQVILYDEMSGEKLLSDLIVDKDIVDVDVEDIITDEDLEKETQQEMSDNNVEQMFNGVEEDSEEEEEESDEQPDEDEFNLGEEMGESSEEPEEEEESEEETTRSLEEIQALVNKKKRGNIDYIGVDAPSPLPTENGPKVNIELDQFAESKKNFEEKKEKKVSTIAPKKEIVEHDHKKENSNMQRREQPKKNKYEKKKDFHSRQERISKKEFKQKRNRLNMEDYDELTSMFK